MAANPWILTLHLISLFFWLGQLLVMTRLLGFHVQQPSELQQRLSPLEKRMWLMAGAPGALLVLVTGLLMLHGVGSDAFNNPGEALRNYLKPRTPDGAPTFWYITFHIKLVSFTLLALTEAWVGAQIFRLARGEQPKRAWPLATLLGLMAALFGNTVVWLVLAGLGVGPASRFIGYGAALVSFGAGMFGGRKLGLADSRAKYSLVHGLVAALLLLIVILVIARPLAYAGHTLE